MLVVAAGALLLRITAIAEPLGIDQGLWASAVRGMARGQLLYRDVWEQRPPGIYWIYLAGFSLFSWSPATVAWLDLIASTITALCTYVIVARLSTRLTAAVATFLYVTMTMPAWLYGHGGLLERAVSETFITPCVAAAALCASALYERRSLAAGFWMGIFSGAAVALKPNAGLYFLGLLVWVLLYTRDRAALLRPIGIAWTGGAVVPLVALLWLWTQGTLGDAKVAVIDFNRYYVGEGWALVPYVNEFAKDILLRFKTQPLWFAGVIASFVALGDLAMRRRLPPLAGLGIAWGATAALVIVVNGARLYNSYFINAFVPLSILAAWFIAEAARESRIRSAGSVITCAVMLVILVQRDYGGRVLGWAATDLAVLRGREDRTTYLGRFGDYNRQRGYSARANAELAEYIEAHTSPDDRVFVFGINGAELYFAADRLPAHRFLRVNFFVATTFPDPAFRLGAVAQQLRDARPRYVIFERLHKTADPAVAEAVDNLPNHPEVQGLLEAYRFEARVEDFTLYRLID